MDSIRSTRKPEKRHSSCSHVLVTYRRHIECHLCAYKRCNPCFRQWHGFWPAPSHYLNHWWIIVHRNLKNQHKWNLNRNTKILMHWNALEIVVCKMSAIHLSLDMIKDVLKHTFTCLSMLVTIYMRDSCPLFQINETVFTKCNELNPHMGIFLAILFCTLYNFCHESYLICTYYAIYFYCVLIIGLHHRTVLFIVSSCKN